MVLSPIPCVAHPPSSPKPPPSAPTAREKRACSSSSRTKQQQHQPRSRGAGLEAHIPAKRAGWPSHPIAAGSTGGRTRASHLPGRGRVGVGLHCLQGVRNSSTQGLPLHSPLPWRTAPRPTPTPPYPPHPPPLNFAQDTGQSLNGQA